MPIHQTPLSRRQFLASGVATVASLSVLQSSWAGEQADPNCFALLADTHIPDRPEVAARDVNMTENLRQVTQEVVALKNKPAGVIINGDCAFLKGLPEDYANLAECVAPLAEARLPLHLTMGNHDDRTTFYQMLADQRPDRPLVESKHVGVIESPHVNLFLLDSLQAVNVVTGEIGEQQRKWLAEALDARSDKPAVVIAHHNPQFTPPAEGARWGGLQDTEKFFELLASRKQVKAYVYGHTHNWAITKHEGIHLINLPPVAYVFAPGKPNGWIHAQFQKGGVELQLHAIDRSHAAHGEKVELAWS